MNRKLCVSYDETSADLRRHVAEAWRDGDEPIWEMSFRHGRREDLPPGDGPIRILPVFMQHGRVVSQLLPDLLQRLYAEDGLSPDLIFEPVWGAGCLESHGLIPFLQGLLGQGRSLLLIAHGTRNHPTPPEPQDFLERLRPHVSPGSELALAYFGATPSAEDIVSGMRGDDVVVLPFLAGGGVHAERDLPGAELFERHHKRFRLLPPVGELCRHLSAESDSLHRGIPSV